MSKEKAILIFTVAIDVIGLGIIIPVLPVYVESFGVGAFAITLLISVFSLFSFLSAPLLGTLSDKYGRKPVLIGSIASTSVGWLIFAAAKSFPILVLGRIIDGAAAGNFSTAQSSISDIAKDQKERTTMLGMIGMIFGLGFIVGPFIGGLLSKVSTAFPFWFVGGLALLNAILAYIFLPETNRNINKDKKISFNPFVPLVAAIKSKKLRLYYLVYFLFNVVAVMSNSIFALYLVKAFGLTAFTTGLFFAGVGIILAVNQGVLLKKVWLEKFKEKELIVIMLFVFSLGFGLMTAPWMVVFIVGMIMTSLAQSTTGVAITSEIVSEAEIKARGEAVGVMSAVASAATILAPIIAGSLFEINIRIPFLIGSGLSLTALVLLNKTKGKANLNKDIIDTASQVTNEITG